MLTDNMEDFLMRMDGRTKVTYISPPITEKLGYSPKDILGKPSGEYVHPDDIAQLRKELWGAVDERKGRVRLE
jgi:PAS domain S-box-containing protein